MIKNRETRPAINSMVQSQRAAVSEVTEFLFAELPNEVHDRLVWYLSGNEPPLVAVRFELKSKMSKDEAWANVPRPPITERHPLKPWLRNPWRKCHTENYWVWFRR